MNPNLLRIRFKVCFAKKTENKSQNHINEDMNKYNYIFVDESAAGRSERRI